MGNTWTTPVATPIFRMQDNDVLVAAVHLKVEKGEGQRMILAFIFY